MNSRARRRRAGALAAALGLAALACGGERTPNVLLVSIDTLRADAIGAAGGPLPTPTLDALAREGVLFARTIAPAPETAPSHATLFTGTDVLRHGVLQNGMALGGAPPTLAQSFQAAGYATAAFVSSFVLDPRFGWARGFQHYDASFETGGATLSERDAYAGAFWEEYRVEAFDRRAADTTAAALDWLGQAPEPFFVFVHYFDPHTPYDPPPAFVRRAARGRFDLAGRAAVGFSPERIARLIRRYHGEVLYVDHWLGRLLAGLDDLGARGRTLVVVTGDHGEGLGQHGWMEHGLHLYEEQVAVPLIFHRPGQVPPREPVRVAVGLIDVPRTIAELAGVAAPARSRPSPLTAALLEKAELPPPTLFGFRRELPEHENRGGASFSVRRSNWKYIHRTAAPDELYDLAHDPRELRNRLGDHPNILALLNRLLEQHRKRARSRRPARALSADEKRALEALGYVVD